MFIDSTCRFWSGNCSTNSTWSSALEQCPCSLIVLVTSGAVTVVPTVPRAVNLDISPSFSEIEGWSGDVDFIADYYIKEKRCIKDKQFEWSKWVPHTPALLYTKTSPIIPACIRPSHLALLVPACTR